MTNVNTCRVLAQVWPFAQPKGLIPRRAKCEKFRAKTHLCENFLSEWFPQWRKNSPKHKHLIGFTILSPKTQAFDWLRYFHFAAKRNISQRNTPKSCCACVQPFRSKFFAFRSSWNKALTEQLNQARELVILFQSIITSCFAGLARNVTTRQFTLYHGNCMHAWSTKSIGQNNSLVADQILIECQFTKLEAGVTNNLLSYHKERDHCTMRMCK
jgi:hypothetical protein